MPLHEVLTCRGPPKNPIQIPSARLRSKLHSILPFSLATPATSRPRCRLRSGAHGTRAKPGAVVDHWPELNEGADNK
jgi:hypothetical protein